MGMMNDNAVNSGNLSQETILIQAARAEGATTILAGGVGSNDPKRSASHRDDDMVFSCRRLQAVRKDGNGVVNHCENKGIMQATLSWDVVAKARNSNSAQSFESSMTQVVDNVLLSHRRHTVADMLYGGDNWGVVSPGAASATQTITKASCAPALWYGSTNMLVIRPNSGVIHCDA
jgi:hypothetical protein